GREEIVRVSIFGFPLQHLANVPLRLDVVAASKSDSSEFDRTILLKLRGLQKQQGEGGREPHGAIAVLQEGSSNPSMPTAAQNRNALSFAAFVRQGRSRGQHPRSRSGRLPLRNEAWPNVWRASDKR